jgi:hypothetical protein
VKIIKLSNFIPNLRNLSQNFSDATQSVMTTLGSARRRNLTAAFAVAGALGGSAMCYGLGESIQDIQMDIRGVSAAQYDQEQVRDAFISAGFYGGVGTAFGLMAAGLMAPQARRREEPATPSVISDAWIAALNTGGVADMPIGPSPVYVIARDPRQEQQRIPA